MNKLLLMAAGIAFVAMSMPQISLAAPVKISFTTDASLAAHTDVATVELAKADASTRLAKANAEQKQKEQNKQTLQPKAVLANFSASAALSGEMRVGHFTAYTCIQAWECDGDPTTAASGAKTHWGMIAAPGAYPFGTKMKIEGFPDTIFVIEDRGGAIKGDRFDIWMSNLPDAFKFGRRTLHYQIVK